MFYSNPGLLYEPNNMNGSLCAAHHVLAILSISFYLSVLRFIRYFHVLKYFWEFLNATLKIFLLFNFNYFKAFKVHKYCSTQRLPNKIRSSMLFFRAMQYNDSYTFIKHISHKNKLAIILCSKVACVK